MALPSFCRDAVTRLRPGTRLSRGTPVSDWDAATPATIAGCSIQEVATTGTTLERRADAVSVDARLYAPPGADLMDGDRVVDADGTTWEIVGHPLPKRSPTGLVSHVVAYLAVHRG